MGRPPKAAEAAAPRAALIDRLVTFPTSDPRVASDPGSLDLAFATAPSASALAFAAPHPMRLLHPGRLPFESALALAPWRLGVVDSRLGCRLPSPARNTLTL